MNHRLLALLEVCLVSVLFFSSDPILGAALPPQQAEGRIVSDHFANCLILGDTVVFKPETALPEGTVTISASLSNSTGVELSRHLVSSASFVTTGWRWKPAVPGFYEITFAALKADGTTVVLVEKLTAVMHRHAGGKAEVSAKKELFRAGHGLAVLPGATRKPGEMPSQVGISLGWGMEKKEWIEPQVRLATLAGFHYIRLHPIFWGRIEKERGQFNWELLDTLINQARERGFEDFIGNPMGTPLWAASDPSQEINILPHYVGSKPKDLKDWTNFLTVLVQRYPFIKTWELWNEPHLPGQSIFWHDSPEDFEVLLQSGYETIKKLQPDATVWLGGIGMRYLPFYEKLMRLGAGRYFDRLALHLNAQYALDLEAFRVIDRKNAVEPKPWVDSEWHAILVSASDMPTPAEEELCQNFVIDFMNQIRLGAQRITFFGLSNHTWKAVEMETMEFYRQNGGGWEHAPGLFRSLPQVEARLPLVVWRNFIDQFSGTISYGESYGFGEQCAVLMRSERGGEVLCVWQNSGTPAVLSPELARAIGGESTVLDWEGRPQPRGVFQMSSATIYFIRHPDMAVVSKWTNRANVLRRYGKEVELDQSVQGRYRQGKIFGAGDQGPDVAGLVWNDVKSYVPVDRSVVLPKALSARYALSMESEGLDLLVEVKDAKFHQPNANRDWWNGDSVQFALDTVGKGRAVDRLEFIAALTPKGPVLVKTKASSLGGDLPTRFTPEGRPVANGSVKIDPIAGGLRYRIHVAREDLYPLAFTERKPLRFALLVNNNDGAGRAGYLEWANGIGAEKNPAAYGTLTADVGVQEVLSTRQLTRSWGSAKLSSTTVEGTSMVKIVSTAAEGKGAAAVATAPVAIYSGVRYRISFQARGDVTLAGMLTLYASGDEKGKRFDFATRESLDANWRTIEKVVTIPEGVERASLSLFCWQQNGQFEVRQLTMGPTP